MNTFGKPRHVVWLLGLATCLIAACGGGGKSPTAPCSASSSAPVTVPLQTGNRWSYAMSVVQSGHTDTLSEYDEVTGTQSYLGQSYAVYRSVVTSAPPDTTVTLVRQSGQDLYIVLSLSTLEVDTSAVGRWAQRKLEAGMPWRLASFQACGQIGSYAADTTVVEQGQQVKLTLTMNAASLDRATVQVPAGSFSDVGVSRLTQLLVISSGGVTLGSSSQMMDFYIKDAVGIVKQATTNQFQQTGFPAVSSTTTSVLRSYHLAS